MPQIKSWAPASAVDRVIDNAIQANRLVGVSLIIALEGKVVYQRTAGFADRETHRFVQSADLFRIASMTKLVVSIAALSLIEEGLMHLDDPVSRWLPYFRPALATGQRPKITLRHLMTHTSGLSYGFLSGQDGGDYRRLGISDGLDNSGISLEENLRRLSMAPLLFTPGSAWHYSLSTDVLGAIIERATGLSLPEAVARRVTQPLGLSSMRFVASLQDPLAIPYGDGDPQPVRMSDPFTLPFFGNQIIYAPSRVFHADTYPSGGVGMVGNAEDYLRLLEALRQGGAPLLKKASVNALTTNAIGTLATNAGPGFGWGLGVSVLLDPQAAKLPMNAGSWNWAGVYGTNFWVDPTAKLSVVALTNTAVSGMTGDFPLALRHAVYSNQKHIL
ncbi:beta-lactamase family protein [Yersinia canariae]|uniref:Beta-lactamase family protein n=2 Tax=Yersinia canariae TaxID=2607663 RepID=A0A857F5S2_9GAMM|nr:beta-lactamase family protein [Yersinia canariae]